MSNSIMGKLTNRLSNQLGIGYYKEHVMLTQGFPIHVLFCTFTTRD
jgi:hypothetical protein